MKYFIAAMLVISLSGCEFVKGIVQPIVQPLDEANKACEQSYNEGTQSDIFYQALCKADIIVQAGWVEYTRQKEMGVLQIYLNRWSSKLYDAATKLDQAETIYRSRQIDTLSKDQVIAELLLEIQKWAYKDG